MRPWGGVREHDLEIAGKSEEDISYSSVPFEKTGKRDVIERKGKGNRKKGDEKK